MLSLSVKMQNGSEWVTSGKLNRINLCFHNDSQDLWIFESKTTNTSSWSSVHTVLNDNTLSVPSIFFMPILFLSVSLILLCVSILFTSGTAVVRLWCNCKEIMALWHVSKIFPGYWSAGRINRQGKTITTTTTTEKEEVDARKEGKERPLLLPLNSWWLTILLVFA